MTNDTAIINLCGNPIKVNFDVMAMMDVEQTLQLMKAGLVNREFMSMLEPPYDTRDIVVMIMHGINGANRAEGIDKRLGYPEAQKLFGDHLKYISGVATDMPTVNIMINQLKTEISNAAKKGVGIFTVSPIAQTAT